MGLGLLTGAAVTVGIQTFAQTNSTNSSSQSSSQTPSDHPHGHAPLGNDGNITAINGTTITMQEEADEGGASYTVDASKVTLPAGLKVGDKIFVEGTVSGNTVTATTVSVGHPGGPHGWFDSGSK